MGTVEDGVNGTEDELSSDEALRRMYRITADPERPFGEKLQSALALGRVYLGVEAGFLTEIDEETQVIVAADGDRLRQLFENLFRNSVEHGSTGSRSETGDSVEHGSTSSRPEVGDSAEHGDAEVTVRVGDLADGSGIYVEDDGPGLPADDPGRVFDDGFTTGENGTGLGLTIVRQVADAHGWTVVATESAHGGARFEFSGVDFGGPATATES